MTPRAVWAVLVGLYGLDVVVSQDTAWSLPLGLLLTTSGVVMARLRIGAALAALIAFLALVGPAQSTQTAFVMWASAALFLFTGEHLSTALRVQAGSVYLFAAANKAVGPFLRGEVLAPYAPDWLLPVVLVLAPIAVVYEAALGVSVLARWRYALAGVVVFHVPTAFAVGLDWRHRLSLLIYGAMMGWAVVHGTGDRG